MIRLRTLALVFGCFPASLGADAAETPTPATSPAFPSRLSLRTETRWGYGCGGHCAFNHSGESAVSVESGEGGVVRVTDSGIAEVQANHPDGVTFTARRWDLIWAGTSRADDRTRRLELKAEHWNCVETTSNGGKKEQRPCGAKVRTLVLGCVDEKVKAHVPGAGSAKVGAGQDVKAVICRPLGDGGSAVTEFPWVFGVDTPIKTLKSGEPHAEIRYVLEQASKE